jgi:hypothetical protein
MIWNRLWAAKLVVLCLACIVSNGPDLPAQESNTPQSEIYGPPRYRQAKLPDGSVEFTDLEVGVSFTLPGGWGLGNDGLRFLDRGWKGNGDGNFATSVLLRRRHSNEAAWLYYCAFRNVYPMTPDRIDRSLDSAVDGKISQRRLSEKLKGYRVRPSSYEREEIGGQRALTWVADFTEGKMKMAEYLVWVRTERTLVELSIRCPESELDTVRKDVEPVVLSVRMR